MPTQFKKYALLSILAIGLMISGSVALAQDKADPYGLDTTAGEAGINTESTNLPVIVGNIINYLFVLVGVIFLTMIIYAGISWLTAGGNEDKISHAKNLIINSIIGVMIVFLAYALVFFVLTVLQAGTGGTAVS